MKTRGRPEPLYVVMCSDDLWLGVICQTNLEIAGSPRKVYRHRGRIKFSGGRATGWNNERKQVILTKLRITLNVATEQSQGAKLLGRKGNIPDFQLRSLNYN